MTELITALYKVLQDNFSILRCDGFWMKLYLQMWRINMLHAHDDIIVSPCSDFQFFRGTRFLDDQRMGPERPKTYPGPAEKFLFRYD